MSAVKLDYPPMTPYLPYRYFDAGAGVFVNSKSLGFALEIPTFSGANEEIVTRIHNFLMDKVADSRTSDSWFSKSVSGFQGYDFGIYLYASDKIGWALDTLDDKRDDIFGKINKISKAFLNHSRVYGVKNNLGLNLRLRDYRAFLVVSTPATRYKKELAQELIELREDVLNTFKGAKVLDDAALLLITRSLLNPDNKSHLEPIQVDKTQTLDEQALDSNFELEHHENRLIVKHSKYDKNESATLVNLSLERLPNQFALWQTPDSYFNLTKPQDAIGCPFLISLHFRLEPYAKSKDEAQKKFLKNDKMANSPMGRIFASYQGLAQDWGAIRSGLEDKQFKLAKVFYNLMLISDEANYKKDRDLAIESFQGNGIKLKCQNKTQLQSLISLIPFNMSEGCFEDLRLYRRIRTMTTVNVVDLLPIVSDPSGAVDAGAFFSTYRNQCFLFDPFYLAGTANANIAIAGFSGGGKSFLLQHILYNIISRDGIVFVIDIGGSYKKLTQLLARYIKASYINAASLKLSPFAHLKSKEDLTANIEQLVNLLSIMASPNASVDQSVKVAMSSAISEAFNQHGPDTLIDHVIEEMRVIAQVEQHSEREILKAAFNLKKYASDSPDGEVFNGSSQLDPEARLVVLEMGEFEAKPDLKAVVMYSIIMNITQRIYRSDRSTPKMCLIDEAWRLLKSDNEAAANFIAEGFKTVRKHGGLFCTIVQHLNEYIDNVMAHAIWDNSNFKLILRPEATAFETFLQKHPNILSVLETKMVRGFGEAKDQGFSSALLKYGQGSFYLRLSVDPFSRVLFSTEPKEFQAVKDLMKEGHGLEEAVMRVAKARYPQECEELGL